MRSSASSGTTNESRLVVDHVGVLHACQRLQCQDHFECLLSFESVGFVFRSADELGMDILAPQRLMASRVAPVSCPLPQKTDVGGKPYMSEERKCRITSERQRARLKVEPAMPAEIALTPAFRRSRLPEWNGISFNPAWGYNGIFTPALRRRMPGPPGISWPTRLVPAQTGRS